MIELRRVNLMGYTAETQMWFIQNGGGKTSVAVSNFLQKHRKFFDLCLHCGQHWYGLRADRIAKFQAYCEGKGFEVKVGAPV